jgi:putative transposase
MVRHSLNYVSWKRRPEVAADLKRIYACATAEEAEQRLFEFEVKWDKEYLPIGQSSRRNWPRLIPFFDYPPEIRKVIYTTNAIQSVNMSLRKLTKNRDALPSDDALVKLFYLALRNISKKWTLPIRDWKAPLNRFTSSSRSDFLSGNSIPGHTKFCTRPGHAQNRGNTSHPTAPLIELNNGP